MAHPNEDLMRQATDALNAGDMETFLGFHADVVPVHTKRLDAMRISGLDDVVFDAALPDVHVTRIEVVFANENDRKTVQAGKVKRLMKMTFLRCAIAKKRDRNPGIAGAAH